ncbi:hypothetical protein AFAE65S_00596 [Alcaligenes phenolicus]
MAVKRSIRLKEVGVSIRRFNYPPSKYLTGRVGLSTEYGYTFITDENGFSLSTIPSLASDRKIFFAGGSSIEASYCDINKRVPFVFQERLLEVGIPCTCFNMGVSGATSLNLFNVMMNKLIHCSGDMIFFVPSNDVLALELESGYLNGTRYYTNLVPDTGENYTPGYFDKNKSQIFPMLRMISSFCREFGFDLYVSGVIYKKPNKKFSEINLMVENFCLENGIKYISIEDYPSDSFYDSVHLTSKGSCYVANRVFDEYININKKIKEVEVKKKINFDDFTYFDISKSSSVSLFVDVECVGDVLPSSLLAYFDFSQSGEIDREQLYEVGLSFSKIVGPYKYLELPGSGRRCVMQYTFRFPDSIKNLGIGLKKWHSRNSYKVHSAVAYYRA